MCNTGNCRLPPNSNLVSESEMTISERVHSYRFTCIVNSFLIWHLHIFINVQIICRPLTFWSYSCALFFPQLFLFLFRCPNNQLFFLFFTPRATRCDHFFCLFLSLFLPLSLVDCLFLWRQLASQHRVPNITDRRSLSNQTINIPTMTFFCHSLEFLRFILYIFNETTFTFSLCYILFRSFISLPFYCPPLQSHINQ